MRELMDWLGMLYMIAAVHLVRNTDALLCYCTEEQCVSGDRSNMCVQKDPSLGCYKQYFSKESPSVSMGCVTVALMCDSSRIRPPMFDGEWPIVACCYNNHCNKNLSLPIPNIQPKPELPIEAETAPPSGLEITITERGPENINSAAPPSHEREAPETNLLSPVHPVFILLIVLVVIFFMVVVASVLVIIKIWFYRRRKAKPSKRWILQEKSIMAMRAAQTSHLLPDHPSDTSSAASGTSVSNMTTGFDVP